MNLSSSSFGGRGVNKTQKDRIGEWNSIRHQSMDELAQEIGRLCMYWSELEFEIAVFLAALLDLNETVRRSLILGALDFRAKLTMLLPIGFKRKPTEHWYESLEKLVNHIDHDLRPERNRIIHDYWTQVPTADSPEGVPHRITLIGRVIRPQARLQELKLGEVKPFTAKDVGVLYVSIIQAQTRMIALRHRLFPPSLPPIPRNPSDNRN